MMTVVAASVAVADKAAAVVVAFAVVHSAAFAL